MSVPSTAIPTFRRIAHGLMALTICLSLGFHWVALQGIAWTGMLISYSRDGTLMEAVEKTFDGAHPCHLCQAVEKGSKETPPRDAPAKDSLKKMDAVMVQVAVLIAPTPTRASYPELCVQGVMRAHLPLRKPPRAVMA